MQHLTNFTRDYGWIAGVLLLIGNGVQYLLGRKKRTAEVRRVDVDTVEKLTRMFNELLDKGEARRAQFDHESDELKGQIATLKERIRVGEDEREILKEQNMVCQEEMVVIKERLSQLEVVRNTEPLGPNRVE